MNNIDIGHEQHCHLPWTALIFTMNNSDIDLEQHCNLPWTTLTLAMNNIDICHEQHCHLPWTALTFTINNSDIDDEQHCLLQWAILILTMNNIDIYHEQHLLLPWTTFIFIVNNIDICHEHTDVYNTWCKNLILKTTSKIYCKISLSGFVSINSKLRSSVFWGVRQRRSVVTDVSVRLQRSSDRRVSLDSLTLEDGTDRLYWNVGK